MIRHQINSLLFKFYTGPFINQIYHIVFFMVYGNMHLQKPLLWAGANIISGAIPATIVDVNDQWYKDLEKPAWNPPQIAFPIIWTVLNGLIGISASLVVPHSIGAFLTFSVNRILAISWSPVFFNLKNIKLANTIAKLLIISALSMICTFNNRFSVILLIPYLLWLIFAQALNSSIVYLNK